MYFNKKYFAPLFLVFALTNCHVATFNGKEKSALYINKVIAGTASLEIETEAKKGFSIEVKNASKNDVVLHYNQIKKKVLPKDSVFMLTVDYNSSLKIQNNSEKEALLKMKVFNHTTKVVLK